MLGIEERPFKRLTKRILAPATPINSFLARKSSPDEDAENANVDATAQHEQFLKDIQRFREDVTLDFAAFESSIARIQFLRAANERERERYSAEKLKIEATAAEVRDNTSNLRVQLDEAQRTLAIQKTYDVLADKITKKAALKPRNEQHSNIEKLKAEIEELEREAQEHAQAWSERREQLQKVVYEGARLRRVIRDEKEPDKDDDVMEQDEDNMLGVERARDGMSNAGTPRLMDEAPTPLGGLRESAAASPRSTLPEGGTATPRRVVEEDVDASEDGFAANIVIEKPADEMDTT